MSCLAEFIENVKMVSSLSPLLALNTGFLMAYSLFKRKPRFFAVVSIFVPSFFALILVPINPYFSVVLAGVAYLSSTYVLSKIFEKLPIRTSEPLRMVNLFFGILLGFSSMFLKGINAETLMYTLNVTSYSYMLYIFKSPSLIPSLFLTLSFTPLLFEDLKFSTFSSAVLMVSLISILIISFNEISRSDMSRGVLMRTHRFISLYIVFGLAFVIFNASVGIVEPIFQKMERKIFEQLETTLEYLNEVHEDFGVGYEQALLKIPFPWTVEYFEVSGKESFRFGDPSKACLVVSRNFGDTSMKIGVSLPFLNMIFSIIRITFVDIMTFVLIFVFVHRSLYLRWARFLDEEIKLKTSEIVAANEELVALNEELVSMNEDMEKMYSDLSELNEKIISFLTFLREVSIKEDLREIFSNLLEHMLDMFKAKVRGLKLLDTSSGEVLVSVGGGGYPIISRIGDVAMEIYFEEVVELSEEDEKLLNIVASASYFIAQARIGYEKLEKSSRASTRVLELLDMVMEASTRKEIEEVLLEKVLDVFEDVVVVGIGWKDSMTDDSLVVKFMKKDFDSPKIEILRGKGIMRIALETGREYLTQDAKNDPNFLIVDERSNSAFAVPLKGSGDETIGVFIVERSKKNAFTEDDIKLMNIFARITAVAVQKVEYFKSLKKTFIQTVEALAMAIELKDPYTHGHSRRVADYSVAIAKELKLPEEVVERIELAALLHDIGKIGIRGYILNKPTRLTAEEYEEIKKHPALGEELVSRVEALKSIAKIIRHHHENWGGGGYPDGLKDGEIPLESRIIAIADAFDSMTSDRPYRKALSLETALGIIQKNERLQWDPNIIPIAVEVLRRVYKEVRGKYVA